LIKTWTNGKEKKNLARETARLVSCLVRMFSPVRERTNGGETEGGGNLEKGGGSVHFK